VRSVSHDRHSRRDALVAKMNEQPKRERFLSVLMLALAACGQTEQASQMDPAAPRRTTKSAPLSTHDPAELEISLKGDWRVAGLDGTDFDEPVGIALKGDSGSIWWEPRCAGMARAYQVSGRAITFRSLDPPRAPGSPTPPVCAIGLPPRLVDIFATLDAATSIERTPANGIQIAGGGRSVTLFSQ